MIWYDNYNIGIERIDKQHQQLAKTIRKLQQSLVNGQFCNEAGETLKFIATYTKEHFNDEEALMEEVNYDDLKKHKILHEKLITQVVDILLTLKKGKHIDPYELIDFLTEWLRNHIIHEDKKIGKFIERQNK